MIGSTNAQNRPPIVIYGFEIDSAVSSTPANLTFTRGAAGMDYDQRAEVYTKHVKPCVVSRSTGDVNYYLDPTNGNLKVGGGNSKLDGTDGDVCVCIDTTWYKSYINGTKQVYEFSFQDPKDIGEVGFECWCHKYGDLTLPYILPGMFKASGSTSACYSVSTTDRPARTMTMAKFETAYTATGVNSPAQYCGVGLPERGLIGILLTFLSGSTNSQGFFGLGYVNASGPETGLSATNLGFAPTNMLKSGDTSAGLSGVMSGYFNNLWGNVNEFCHQAIFNDYKIKCSYRHDDHIANMDTATYAGAPKTFYETRVAMNTPSESGWSYVRSMMAGEGPCCMFPKVLGGSSGTYFCDAINVETSAVTNRCVRAGARFNYGGMGGLFCMYLAADMTDTYYDTGSRLLIRPIQLAK